jgi:hypothetical protein
LVGLIKNLEGVSQVVAEGDEFPHFDYQCPLLSLPLAFKTNLYTIPSDPKYINLENHKDQGVFVEGKIR